jgi:sulfhydrogenase subunit beta (sulfur reductase)
MSDGWKFLKRDDLPVLLDELARDHEVWLPKKPLNRWDWFRYEPGDRVRLRNTIIDVSAKKLFFPRRRTIATFDPAEKWNLEPVELPTGPRVVFGMHPCDVRALKYTDKVYLDSEHPDRLYQAERERTTIVGMACSEMMPTCHCTDRDLSPDETEGMDVVFHEVEDGYLFKSLTAKGKSLLSSSLLQKTDREPAPREWPKGRYPVPAPDALMALYDDEFWLEASDICLTCGGCTFACPTCTCFLVADEKFEGRGERVTCWDTCQFLSYSRETSGHNPRKTNAARLRNRTLDKFAYSALKRGMRSCIGCGRCALICPIKRSFPQLGAKLQVRVDELKKAKVK